MIERLKIAPNKTLANVRFGDLATFSVGLKTPKISRSATSAYPRKQLQRETRSEGDLA